MAPLSPSSQPATALLPACSSVVTFPSFHLEGPFQLCCAHPDSRGLSSILRSADYRPLPCNLTYSRLQKLGCRCFGEHSSCRLQVLLPQGPSCFLCTRHSLLPTTFPFPPYFAQVSAQFGFHEEGLLCPPCGKHIPSLPSLFCLLLGLMCFCLPACYLSLCTGV